MLPEVKVGMGVDLDRSAVARYIQLATLFRNRIESGQWPVGRQIPTIEEMAAECGVARATIRQAVGMLEAEGLIARFRAKGTFVLEHSRDRIWCDVVTDWQSLLSARPDAVIELISEETIDAPPFVPHAIGELSNAYRYLRRRHWWSDQPFLIADVYIDAVLSNRIPKSAFTTKTAMKLASSMPGVEIINAQQTLTISGADIETAMALEAPLNAPVAHVHRTAVDQHGRIVLIANGIYRGESVRLDLKLK